MQGSPSPPLSCLRLTLLRLNEGLGMSAQTVGEAGEEAVLKVILEELGDPAGSEHGSRDALSVLTLPPGDDAAILELPADGEPARIVLTTDTLSQDQDFRQSWWGPGEDVAAGTAVGLKAAAQNLSDLNAMAATPISLLVSLTLPPETSLDWVRGFYRGMAQAISGEATQQCSIAGGDLGSGPSISVSITAIGRLAAGRAPLRRSGTQAGDQLAVSGDLGRAAAGLALMEAGQDCTSAELAALRDAQIAPRPRLASGIQAIDAGATAGMDLSDGLLRDAARLARASGVRFSIADELLREHARGLLPAARALGLPESDTLRWAAAGGEDYALLATFPADATLPAGFRRIGAALRADTPGDADGTPKVILESAIDELGWDSLRT